MTRFVALLALWLALPVPTAWAQPAVVTREAYLMGTRVTLATWDEDRGRGVQRLEALLGPLADTEAQLSTWRADSEVSRLNAAGTPAPLSPSLDRKSTRLNSSHIQKSRMPSSA